MSHWTDTLFREQADLFAETFADRFDAADEQVENLLDLLADERGLEPERTLDVACGVGRHVLALADRDCRAEGLDFSAEFLDRARERARDRGLADRTTFHHHDMRELDSFAPDTEGPDHEAGTYDLITSFWNSLGYYDRETDERVLADLRELLAADGVLAVEMGNRDFFLAEGDEAGVSEDDERLSVYRREYDVETGRFHTTTDWFAVTDDGYRHLDTLEWEQRLYSAPVLRELCERAGFDEVRLFGGFDGRDLTLDEPNVALLAW